MSVMGLDIGTTAVKATIFGQDGTIQGYGVHEYGYLAPCRSWAEQDPEEVWQGTLRVIKQAVNAQRPKEPLHALSLSVQGEAFLPVDRDGNPLRRTILGMDMRAIEECKLLDEQVGAANLYYRSGMPLHPLSTLPKLMWLRRHEPELASGADRFLLYEDYVLLKLGGEPIISYSMAARTLAFDIRTWQWSPELLSMAEIKPEQMARPVPSGQAVGHILPEMARELGLPRHTLLVTGGHDVSCAALGAGATAPGVAVDIIGTAELLSTPLASFDRADIFRNLGQCCYPYLKTGMYLTHTMNQTGGLALRWFVDNFARDQRERAFVTGRSIYDLVIETTPSQPASVLFLPHLVGSGTPWLDARSKAAFIGMDLSTTAEEVVKSILDSLTYELKISMDQIEASGVCLDEIRAVGGGARSSKWLQIRSDILNKRLVTLQVREGSCLGAALLAGTAAGIYASLDDAVARTVRTACVYKPNPERHAGYMSKYEMFKELYPTLCDLNHKL